MIFTLAEKLGKSRGEILRLPSLEITGWAEYFRVKEWLRKSEADDSKKALAFARSVHEILMERLLAGETTDG